MGWEEKIDNELDLLSEYLNVIIQILPEWMERNKPEMRRSCLPTFEDFKNNYDAFTQPAYKESKIMVDGVICNNYAHGLGTVDGIKFRYYNYYHGCKYFTGMNLHGDYTLTKNK